MILVDSSAWIEFLRDTGSPVCEELDRLLGTQLAITDPIAIEILAGARDERHARDLRALLGRAVLLPCASPDYDAAALLFRRCREGGATVRGLIDCLIAAVAIRQGVPILQADRDFDALARHSQLIIHQPQPTG